MAWSTHVRSTSQLFFAAVFAYLVNALVGGRLLVWVSIQVRDWDAPIMKLVLAALLVDGSKLLGLLLAALAIGRAVQLRPLAAATALVGLVVGWELAISAILGQLSPILEAPAPVLLLRFAVLMVLIWATARVFRWRQGPETPAEEPSPKQDG